MEYVSLGKTNLLVSRTAFGAMGLSDVASPEEACSMIKKAYDSGINFFDSSMDKTESERRLGEAVAGFRENVIIATKSSAHSSDELSSAIEKSLANLRTDYIDLYQLERTDFLPDENNDSALLKKLLELKNSSVIKHFGIVSETIDVAGRIFDSGFPWETVQFPFNMLCGKHTEDFVKKCGDKNIGFIAMQPLCGGVLTNIPLAIGFFLPYDNVVPVWGPRKMSELEQILYFTQNPPRLDEQFYAESEKIRAFFN